MLAPGDPAPWFKAQTATLGLLDFSLAGGRHAVVVLLGTAGSAAGAALLAALAELDALWDERERILFLVTLDRGDVTDGRLPAERPGVRQIVDADGAVARQFGALAGGTYRQHWLIVDPALKVAAVGGIDEGARLAALVRGLPPVAALPQRPVPLLIVPDVFEAGLCTDLIGAFDAAGGVDSGYMVERDGQTIGILNHAFKRRRDHEITDPAIRDRLGGCIHRRLVPEIRRAFQFAATRLERFIVACYAADGGGWFGPHRDDTTPGTAHRRFAVTINLNADAFAGGDLRFPEFGPQTFRCPTGAALVFSCTLLHEVTPVTAGRRYVFLPFLYDEAAATQRDAMRDRAVISG